MLCCGHLAPQVINPRCACTVRVTVVGSACVHVSVNQHLTSGASVHLENDTTYSMGNEDQNVCVDFSETALLQRYIASCIVWQLAIFETVMHIISVSIAYVFSRIHAHMHGGFCVLV